MDRRLLHAQAWAPAPTPPKTLSLPELGALSEATLDAHIREVHAYVAGALIRVPQFEPALASMDQTIADNAVSLPGAKDVLFIDGCNVAGKSTLVKHWALQHYREWTQHEVLDSTGFPQWVPFPESCGAHFTPVVVLNLDGDSRVVQVNQQILAFVGVHHGGPTGALSVRVMDVLRNHGVRLLIIDDAHFLRTNKVMGRAVLDHLKHLNTELGERHGSVVLVGAGLKGGPLAADPQLAGRMNLIPVAPVAIDTLEGQRCWQEQLHLFEEVILPYLPGNSPTAFSRDLAPLIWRRTQGFIGETAKLLRKAMHRALRDCSYAVTADHILQVETSTWAQQRERDLYLHSRRPGAR